MKWKDIKSAPKDRAFLGYGIFAGEIHGAEDSPSISVIEKYTERTDYEGFNWVAANTDAYAGWWKLTHWMELPLPPKI